MTKLAQFDLLQIYVDGIEMFGRMQAAKYLAELEGIFELLALNPRMGRPARDLPGVRRHEHAAHVILYEEAPDGVTILALVPARSQRNLRL